jgi:hypothetical protein
MIKTEEDEKRERKRVKKRKIVKIRGKRKKSKLLKKARNYFMDLHPLNTRISSSVFRREIKEFPVFGTSEGRFGISKSYDAGRGPGSYNDMTGMIGVMRKQFSRRKEIVKRENQYLVKTGKLGSPFIVDYGEKMGKRKMGKIRARKRSVKERNSRVKNIQIFNGIDEA